MPAYDKELHCRTTVLQVLGYDRTRGSLVSGAVLAEAAGEPAGVGGAANGPEVDQELWEWLLAAFPGVVTAESQVCQQVLVPGQLCRWASGW